MKQLHIKTPLIESQILAGHSERTVWLKLEALQPSGSFKIRGIGHACQTYIQRGAKRFISSSGGNAGLAVAYAGRQLKVPVIVVVPKTTTKRAIELIRNESAEVLVRGDSWQEANEVAKSLISQTDVLIHPFDDPLLWEGHSSIVDEIANSGILPDAIVLSVGGGGLFCGVAEGMRRHGWEHVPIIAVETHGAASLYQSIRKNVHIELEKISSLATSLGAKQVCKRAFQWSGERDVKSILVSDQSALKACNAFIDDHRILVEPACGASLAAVYENREELSTYTSIVVIVCGGATMTLEQLKQWSKTIENGSRH